MTQFDHVENMNEPLADELTKFFEAGYGPKFLGETYFRGAYVGLATSVTTLRDDRGTMLAAQLLRHGRLTAGATTPQPTEHGSRRKLMTDILSLTRTVEPLGWITIHTESTGMESAATAAGMQKLTDREDIESRLMRFGEADMHTIVSHAGGMAVSLMTSQHGSEYTQLAWGWGRADAPEHSVAESGGSIPQQHKYGLDLSSVHRS